MLKQTINYTDNGRVNLTTYIHSDTAENPRTAIILLPGGGFYMLASGDQEPAAMTFYERGFNAFVLRYSVGDYSEFPAPLDEISWAIWQIRQHAEEWNTNPDAIVPMGFSAGGGLAYMSSTQWNTPGLAERAGAPDVEAVKPNAAVICYGTADMHTIWDTPGVYIPNGLGKLATDRTPELDAVNYVGEHTPPMFIWHNRSDQMVPAVNPVLMANALLEYNILFELHIFQEGNHGMSVGENRPGGNLEKSEHPNVDMWVPMCANWLNTLFKGR